MKTPQPRLPRLEGEPAERVAAYVELARREEAFGADLAFDRSRWDVTDHVRVRRGVPVEAHRLYVHFDEPGSEWVDRPSETGLLARAFVRMLPGRLSQTALTPICSAFRRLEKAMRAGGVASVCDVTEELLDAVVDEAREDLWKGAVYVLGINLRRIARFLTEAGMTREPLLAWVPQTRKPRLPDPGSPEAARRADARLPSPEAMAALPVAFRLAETTTDVVATRVASLFFVTTERINETLAVGELPEVERVLDGKSHLGLRWAGSKLHPDDVRWLASVAVPMARRCLEDLREVTMEGRRIKRWYDANSEMLYLPPHLEYLRGKARLFAGEVTEVLGVDSNQAHRMLSVAGGHDLLPSFGRFVSPIHNLSFAALERFVLRRLPNAMRLCGGPATNPLLVLQYGAFSILQRTPCPCMFQAVTSAQIHSALNPGPRGQTVFQRHGLDPDGTMALKSHQPRHLLTTELKRGNLAESALAVMAGRVDPRQNRHYDHRTMDDLVGQVARGTARSEWVSPLAGLYGKPTNDSDGEGDA